jgi:hypothetical protein
MLFMKIRLLTPTALDYYSFDAFLTQLLSYINKKGGSAGFTNCTHTINASSQNIPLLKTDLIFLSYPALPYTSETIAGKGLNTHPLVKLNV